MMLSVASPTFAYSLLAPQAADLYGDYNADSKVDAFDYVAWRKSVVNGLGDMPPSINIEPLVTPAPLEGGFVVNQLSAANYHLWTTNFGSSASISSDLDSHLIGYSGSLDGWSTVDAAGYVVWRNFGTLGNGGFVARSINLDEIISSLPLSSQTNANRDDTPLESSDGGLISIDPNPPVPDLAKSTNRQEGESSDSAEPSLLRSQSDRVSAPLSTHREIFGEWARAAVFEIAGGEPMANRVQTEAAHSRSAAASTPSSPSDSAPSSLVAHTDRDHSPRTSKSEAPHAAATSHPAAGRGAAASQPAIDLSDHSAAADSIPFLDSQAAFWLIEPSRHALPLQLAAYPQLDEAVDLAFDQIGDGEHVLTPLSSDRSRLDNWIGGAPLLLMFALERISARSSRRRRAAERRLEAIQFVSRKT
jgi:hypothetical protein